MIEGAPPPGDWSGYFVGIGAQKAGTTWLSNALFALPEVYQNPIKEMHVFDRAHLGPSGAVTLREERAEARMARQEARVRAAINGPDDPKLEGKQLIVEYLVRARAAVAAAAAVVTAPTAAERVERYRAYFADRVADDETRFGEITPAYALLPRAGFAEILECYPDARFVFVLRDPVDRLWAGVRQHHKAHPYRAKKLDHDELLEAEANLARSRYEDTLAVLDDVVAPAQLHVAFYEDLFDPASGSRDALGRFLGVELAADVGERANVGVDIELTPGRERRAAELLATTYGAVEQRMGRVPERWHERWSLVGGR